MDRSPPRTRPESDTISEASEGHRGASDSTDDALATERYLPVEMPERFVLEVQLDDGSWMDWGAYKADYFQRLDDGTYVGGGNGSPVWIRCVEKHPDHFVHVDGGGDRFHYRLVALPSAPDDD